MGINFLCWYFILMAFIVNILGYLVNYCAVPGVVRSLFVYGKSSMDKTTSVLSIPKSWFLHFYLLGAAAVTAAMVFVIRVNIVGVPVPPWLQKYLYALTGVRQAGCTPEAVVLATCLFSAQIYRRLYEHLFVHVTSNTRMHIGHYLAGVLHYLLGVTALLAEAPGFVVDDSSRRLLDVTRMGWLDRVAGAIFMLAWLHQYRAHCILAQLRRNDSGEVVSRGHAVPSGDWFSVVSCPHYLAEVLMYTCLVVIIGHRHGSWLAVWFWVISNQVAAALMSHRWYLQKFDTYPRERRAIFPLVL